jgi:hypothetical protein
VQPVLRAVDAHLSNRAEIANGAVRHVTTARAPTVWSRAVDVDRRRERLVPPRVAECGCARSG